MPAGGRPYPTVMRRLQSLHGAARNPMSKIPPAIAPRVMPRTRSTAGNTRNLFGGVRNLLGQQRAGQGVGAAALSKLGGLAARRSRYGIFR